ncbi:hypothetical protein FO433_06305 [Weissella cibaria]|uniref:hypothetical protein n=1 Tax=Weissella cibaria TaxID=137591 RepID=UPI00119764B8|nr:hypothetical protein [Weissella cibaria]TVV25397.1 hypothetical protein FO433_06305 [Weissella cibaria]
MDAMEKAQRIENWLQQNGSVQVMVAEFMAKNPPVTVQEFLATNDCGNKPETGLEGILTQEGLWYDLRGSHSMMLNALAARDLNTTIEDYIKSVPKVCYTAMTAYAMKITGAMSVHNGVQQYANDMTPAQRKALDEFATAGLITVKPEPVRIPPRMKVQFVKLVQRQRQVLAAN